MDENKRIIEDLKQRMDGMEQNVVTLQQQMESTMTDVDSIKENKSESNNKSNKTNLHQYIPLENESRIIPSFFSSRRTCLKLCNKIVKF